MNTVKRIEAIMYCMFLMSCAPRTTYMPLTYSGEKPIFPAIYKVITDRQLIFRDVNLLKNRYVTSYIYKNDLLVKIRFLVKLYQQDNQIQATITNLESRNSETQIWEKRYSTLTFNGNAFRNELLDEIRHVLHSPVDYANAKNAALTDFRFNMQVMDSMTEVAVKAWIENGLIDRVFSWELPLQEFRETDPQLSISKKYQYEADFSVSEKQSLLGFPLGGQISISLYTNSDRFAAMNKGDIVKVQGKLISAYKVFLNNYSFNFAEQVEITTKLN